MLAIAARAENVGSRMLTLRHNVGLNKKIPGGWYRTSPHGKSGNPAFSSTREIPAGISYQAGSQLDAPIYKPLVPSQEVEVPCRTCDAAFSLARTLMADYYASLE
mmetsp:Transcript_16818/g.30471  ORF Transcript_16818/g.30471 Transcript_16818/m.30471 type:complete len:105 (-) Transcript_16818:133-447(-)